jgi:dCMP deaminase
MNNNENYSIHSTDSNSFLNKLHNLTKESGKRLNWDEYFMCMAVLTSIRSSCERLHVGCVLTKNNRVVSAGYNGFLSGAPHRSIVRDNHEQCTVHAEQNSITDSAKRGVSLEGCTAYVTHYPCLNCAKLLVSSGIKTVRYKEDYKNDELVEYLFNQVNIDIVKMK